MKCHWQEVRCCWWSDLWRFVSAQYFFFIGGFSIRYIILASKMQHARITSGLGEKILKGSRGEIEKRQAAVANKIQVICPNLIPARLIPLVKLVWSNGPFTLIEGGIWVRVSRIIVIITYRSHNRGGWKKRGGDRSYHGHHMYPNRRADLDGNVYRLHRLIRVMCTLASCIMHVCTSTSTP